jgi:hypothetical protein
MNPTTAGSSFQTVVEAETGALWSGAFNRFDGSEDVPARTAPIELVGQVLSPDIMRNESYPRPPGVGGRDAPFFVHPQSQVQANTAECGLVTFLDDLDEGHNKSEEAPKKKAKKTNASSDEREDGEKWSVPNAPKKSLTAWMLFRTATTPSIKADNPGFNTIF